MELKYLVLKLNKKIDITGLADRIKSKVSRENNIEHPSDFNKWHLKKEYTWKDIAEILIEEEENNG